MMAVNVQAAGSEDLTVEESTAMRAEIRRCIEEIERLHQQMQRDDARAEISGARRRAMLQQLQTNTTTAFGAPPRA
jgi:hypothetical protein